MSSPARSRALVATLALLAATLPVLPAGAETLPTDARSLSMGGATTALTSGPYLQLYNPAAVAQEARITLFYPLLLPSVSFRASNTVGSIDDISALVQSFVDPNSVNRSTLPSLANGFAVDATTVTPLLGFTSGALWSNFSVGFGLWGKAAGLVRGRATEDASSFFSSLNVFRRGFTQLSAGSFNANTVGDIDRELASLRTTTASLFVSDQNINGNGYADGHLTLGLSFAYAAGKDLGGPFDISFGTTAKVFINPSRRNFNNPIDASTQQVSFPLSFDMTASTANNPGQSITQAQIQQLQQQIDAVRAQLAATDPNNANDVNNLNQQLTNLANQATQTVSAKSFTTTGVFITDVPSVGFGMDLGVQANMAGKMLTMGLVLENAFTHWPAKKVTTTNVYSAANSFKPTPTTTLDSVNYELSEPRAIKWGVAYYPNLGDTVVALDVHKLFTSQEAFFRLGAEFGILSILGNKEGENNLRAGSTTFIPLDFSVRTGLEAGGGNNAIWTMGFGLRYMGVRVIDLAFSPIEVTQGSRSRSLAAGLSLGSSFQF